MPPIAVFPWSNRAIFHPGRYWRTDCSFRFLKTNRILPISFDGRRVLIATADPFVDDFGKAISYMLDVASISP